MQENDNTSPLYDYVLEPFEIDALSYAFILKHSTAIPPADRKLQLHPREISIGYAVISGTSGTGLFPDVTIARTGQRLTLSCTCKTPKKRLCEHQTRVLQLLLDNPDIRLFFDQAMRHRRLREMAADYGLEQEADPDEFFEPVYNGKYITIRPRLKELVPLSGSQAAEMAAQLLPDEQPAYRDTDRDEKPRIIAVFNVQKYSGQFQITLLEAATGKDGGIRNPLTPVDPLDLMLQSDQADAVKCYAAISRFQQPHRVKKPLTDIESLQLLAVNPLQLEFFVHNTGISENLTAAALVPVQLRPAYADLHLSVHQRKTFYEVRAQVIADDAPHDLDNITLKYDYFMLMRSTLFLIHQPAMLRVMEYFKNNNNRLLIHQSKFETFREDILARLENSVHVSYTYLRPATKEQLREGGFTLPQERLIYLSDSQGFVLITPVMKYGPVEVSVLSRKQIYTIDHSGNPFTVPRDQEAEDTLTGILLRQHPFFSEQLQEAMPKESFYLPQADFFDETWFLQVFEEWRQHGIQVLGYDELKLQRISPHKGRVSVNVTSGINWFNAAIHVQYGKETVTLKHLRKAIFHKNKFVELADGKLGVLPAEWLSAFTRYFQTGEIEGEQLRFPKTHFAEMDQLFEPSMLSDSMQDELQLYAARFDHFTSIQTVEVPEGLQTTLRPYQQHGLNWLNFLDETGFGGCLADDMGLGKTVQIIAFILSQRKKTTRNINLVVVPAALIFNWQEEVKKFAPSISVYTFHGADRERQTAAFEAHEMVLTTYGTVLSDSGFLKGFMFNYIFLDESQAIKNPESQRYYAVRQLQARNRIALTGTPVENNTYDLFGQFSFVCPGLLGNKQYFREHFSTPIDKFGDRKRAIELQRRIHPFLLRRTKRQVAEELPDKTEMVILCEMGPEQRRVYNAYEKEFRDYLLTTREGDLARESMHILQGLTRLRQICDAPALIDNGGDYGQASAKINVLMEQIELKSPQHKILVFSQFVTMLDLIKKELDHRHIPYAYLTGKTKNAADAVHTFQQQESVRVFLISLKAGGTGLNLTEADYVYLVDPWWNPAVENQAIDRCYRIGQKKNVVAVRLICPDTIEEKMLKLHTTKKELAGDLIKTDTGFLKSLKREDLLGLISHG